MTQVISRVHPSLRPSQPSFAVSPPVMYRLLLSTSANAKNKIKYEIKIA